MKKQLFIVVLIVAVSATAFILHNKYHDHSPNEEHLDLAHDKHHNHDHGEHHDHHDHDEQIEHYEAKKPKSVTDALAMLNSQSYKIDNIIAKNKLDNNDLETIHQSSYSLEAAVDYLKQQDVIKRNIAVNNTLDQLEKIVKSIHDASEDHKENTIKQSVNELKLINNNLQKLM